MPTVRCKFRCIEMGQVEGWGEHLFLFRFKFAAVTGGSDENREFWAATPSGRLEFQSVSRQAFEVGKEYYLDVTPAEQSQGAIP